MTYKEEFKQSLDSPIAFWEKQAHAIDWFEFPPNILSQDDDQFYHWYKGGKLNSCYLALDYHVKNGRGDQLALIYDSPVTNTKQTFTYSELLHETEMVAGMLKDLGLQKGDGVIIYMPMIPQVVFAMLACARLGAVHSVVFGGFAPHELAIRIDDATPKVILAASGGLEIDKVIPYKPNIDAALEEAKHQPDACVIYQRDFITAALKEGRDYDWQTLRATASPTNYVAVEANDPLYILYTSGTTGRPKGIVRDNGGHAVAMHYSMKYIFGAQPGDVFWAASDVGWVVGHSYIVYAPLIYGCTTVLFEGKPIKTPDAGTFWRVISEYNVKVFFTAPTAFRAIVKEDPDGSLKAKYNTECLKALFLAGERTDIATLEWCEDLLKVPVIDHWWQTESGWPMLSLMRGFGQEVVKPGSVGPPVCGYDIRVLNDHGDEVNINEEGSVVMKYPLPPGCLPNLWRDTDRFRSSYLDPFPGFFYSGDGGYRDHDNYFFITGRMDDIINVAGHRLSTAAMEEVLSAHEAVAECAVIGVQDRMKGHIPIGFYIEKDGVQLSELEIEKQLIADVRKVIGPVASFKRAIRVQRLPKTRSGKILRKIMRAIADGKSFTPPSTIEDMSVLGELEEVMAEHEICQKVG